MSKVSRLSILGKDGFVWEVSESTRTVAYEAIISSNSPWICFVVDTGVHTLLPRENLLCIEVEFES